MKDFHDLSRLFKLVVCYRLPMDCAIISRVIDSINFKKRTISCTKCVRTREFLVKKSDVNWSFFENEGILRSAYIMTTVDSR